MQNTLIINVQVFFFIHPLEIICWFFFEKNFLNYEIQFQILFEILSNPFKNNLWIGQGFTRLKRKILKLNPYFELSAIVVKCF